MGTNGSGGEREGRRRWIQAGYRDKSHTRPDPGEKNCCRRRRPGKKTAKGKRNLVGARSLGKSLVPKDGETAGKGGRGKRGKRKGGALGLGHQVNN